MIIISLLAWELSNGVPVEEATEGATATDKRKPKAKSNNFRVPQQLLYMGYMDKRGHYFIPADLHYNH